MVQGEADRLEDGRDAQSGRPAGSAAGADVRRRGGRQRRRRLRRACPPVLVRRPGRSISTPIARCVAAEPEGTGAARPRRDVAGRSARHDRRRRHSHRARRRVVARGARRPADGQGLRRAAPRRSTSTTRRRTVTVDGKTFKEGDWLSIDGTAGEVFAGRSRPRHRNRRRCSSTDDAGREEDRDVQELPAADEVVRQGDAHVGAHQRRHAGADGERHRVRRRRHRPLPHRAHVLRGRPHRRDARDDSRGDARGPEGGAREAAAVSARRLRRHLPGAGRLSGDDPLPRPAAARVPAARRRSSRRTWRRSSAFRPRRFTRASRSCTSSIRCSASAAAASASSIPEITEMQARAIFEAAAIVQKEGIEGPNRKS